MSFEPTEEVDAQYNLGVFYDHGSHALTQSSKRAIKYWTLAANQGHPQAQLTLGVAFYQGKDVTKSDSKAREWWTKAAAQGHELAIENLKDMDEDEGRITTKKKKKRCFKYRCVLNVRISFSFPSVPLGQFSHLFFPLDLNFPRVHGKHKLRSLRSASWPSGQ